MRINRDNIVLQRKNYEASKWFFSGPLKPCVSELRKQSKIVNAVNDPVTRVGM